MGAIAYVFTMLAYKLAEDNKKKHDKAAQGA